MVGTAVSSIERLGTRLEELQSSYAHSLLEPKHRCRGSKQLLCIFSLGDFLYAVPAKTLAEVKPIVGLVQVPLSTSVIAGAIAYHQEIVAVLDISKMLNIRNIQSEKQQWVIILRPRSRQLGILVDSLIGIRPIGNVEHSADSLDQEGSDVVLKSVVFEDRPVALLDLDLLLSQSV